MRACVIAALALMTTLPPAAAADLEANKQLYRSYIEEMWNKRNPSAADRYIAPGFIEHNPNLPSGLDGRKRFVAEVQAAFSDYHGAIQDVVAEDDKVAAWVVWTGTQDGAYRGRPPTGRKLRFATADFFRIENDKIVEHWDVVDSLPRAIALGLVPAPQPPSGSAAPKSP